MIQARVLNKKLYIPKIQKKILFEKTRKFKQNWKTLIFEFE